MTASLPAFSDGGELADSTDKELDGILSTCNRSLAFLSTPAVAASTRATRGFDPSDLNRGVTGYLVLPVKYMRSHAALMKLWCTAVMHVAVSRGPGGRPVNVVLDECAQLGQMDSIQDMLTIGRAYGVKITAVFQSMAQLKRVFPDGQEGVLLANTSQVFFAVQEPQAAEYVSARLGDYTEVVASGGTSSNTSRQPSPQGGGGYTHSWGSSHNWSQVARRLLQAAEVTQLDPRLAVTFHPGTRPLLTRLTRVDEGDFLPRRMGFIRAAFDTACLLLVVAIPAAVLVAGAVGELQPKEPSWPERPASFSTGLRPASGRR
ncbi:MAG: type IV secretory system conjugative DNA transfer family protein [Gemmataceae bacterium]|nr:type IV secretory system conjugative DNA transfer family protein [Gemmataceae bacterium]